MKTDPTTSALMANKSDPVREAFEAAYGLDTWNHDAMVATRITYRRGYNDATRAAEERYAVAIRLLEECRAKIEIQYAVSLSADIDKALAALNPAGGVGGVSDVRIPGHH